MSPIYDRFMDAINELSNGTIPEMSPTLTLGIILLSVVTMDSGKTSDTFIIS